MAELGLVEKFDTPGSTPEKFGLKRPTEFTPTGDVLSDEPPADEFTTPGVLESKMSGKTSTVVDGLR